LAILAEDNFPDFDDNIDFTDRPEKLPIGKNPIRFGVSLASAAALKAVERGDFRNLGQIKPDQSLEELCNELLH
jgi:hypothetical protein